MLGVPWFRTRRRLRWARNSYPSPGYTGGRYSLGLLASGWWTDGAADFAGQLSQATTASNFNVVRDLCAHHLCAPLTITADITSDHRHRSTLARISLSLGDMWITTHLRWQSGLFVLATLAQLRSGRRSSQPGGAFSVRQPDGAGLLELARGRRRHERE